MTRARSSFEVRSWNEEPYEELAGGGKLTLAAVEQALSGDIEGDGAVRWLMSYRSDGTAHYVGLQRVTGTLAGRSGSFVAETIGDFDGKIAAGTWSVVDGSGTDGLTGLRGTGTFEAPFGSQASVELDYELA